MLTLIKNAHLFTPKKQGIKDLLLGAGKIIGIGEYENDLHPLNSLIVKIMDAEGYYVTPGFIDQHVHITGGGGEQGPASRTPEIMLSQLTTAGITTVVGLLGVDGITRSMAGLHAKARALELEGLSTFIYSGAYELPTRTLTGSIRGDLVLINKVIGFGEIAISDHRSTQPTLEMLAKLGAEARVGGMLGGKAGIIHLHVGEGKKGLTPLFDLIENTDLPISQFVPTHVNRIDWLLKQACQYNLQGGMIDLTAGIYPQSDGVHAVDVPSAIERLIKVGASMNRVTVSSDGNGSMPRFDNKGELVSVGVGSVEVLWQDIRKIITNKLLSFEDALSLITSNVAKQLRLENKGEIKVGNDADLVFLDKDLNIKMVMAKGRTMLQEGKAIVKGAYEA